MKNYKDPYLKLTNEQQGVYDRIKKAQDNLRNARETAEERARRRIREELAELEAVRNHAVREAHALYEATKDQSVKRGLATADIKRAMQTKDHVTVTSIWEKVDLSTYETEAERPAFTIDIDSMTGTLYWLDDKDGNRIEGNSPFTINPDEEHFQGIYWWPDFGSNDFVSVLDKALDHADTFVALAREVDAAVRAARGEA